MLFLLPSPALPSLPSRLVPKVWTFSLPHGLLLGASAPSPPMYLRWEPAQWRCEKNRCTLLNVAGPCTPPRPRTAKGAKATGFCPEEPAALSPPPNPPTCAQALEAPSYLQRPGLRRAGGKAQGKLSAAHRVAPGPVPQSPPGGAAPPQTAHGPKGRIPGRSVAPCSPATPGFASEHILASQPHLLLTQTQPLLARDTACPEVAPRGGTLRPGPRGGPECF